MNQDRETSGFGRLRSRSPWLAPLVLLLSGSELQAQNEETPAPPDAPSELVGWLVEANDQSSNLFDDLSLQQSDGTANGSTLKMYSLDDPSWQSATDGIALLDSFYADFDAAEITMTFESWIALSSKCEDLGEVTPESLSRWVHCLVTVQHELAHIDFQEWKYSQCANKANSLYDMPGVQDEQIEHFTMCVELYQTWDSCMRAKDVGPNDGMMQPGQQTPNDMRNACEESWVAYKTGLCLCTKACALPEDSDARQFALDEANAELEQATEDWVACKVYATTGEPDGEGCGAIPGGYPTIGDPPTQLPGFGEDSEGEVTGPTITSCDCDAPIEFDPCAPVALGDGGTD